MTSACVEIATLLSTRRRRLQRTCLPEIIQQVATFNPMYSRVVHLPGNLLPINSLFSPMKYELHLANQLKHESGNI
jgi:hypothetical protein